MIFITILCAVFALTALGALVGWYLTLAATAAQVAASARAQFEQAKSLDVLERISDRLDERIGRAVERAKNLIREGSGGVAESTARDTLKRAEEFLKRQRAVEAPAAVIGEMPDEDRGMDLIE